jgi:hypothetical protein
VALGLQEQKGGRIFLNRSQQRLPAALERKRMVDSEMDFDGCAIVGCTTVMIF